MEHYGFFNGGAEYGQEEFNRYFDNVYRSGIGMNDDDTMQYPVTIGTRQVTVGTGFAILRGFYHYNDSAKVIPLTPDANLPKIYRIILQLDIAQGKTQLLARAGTAASNPKPPALTRNNTVYELSLGQYRIEKSGAVKFVRDERTNLNVCGATQPKNLKEYEQAMKEHERIWQEWFDSQQTKGWRNVFVQKGTPTGAVSGSIWIHELT